MPGPYLVRPAVPGDARAMARLHVHSWRQTYRGLMPDQVLDAPDAVETRERFWVTALTHERHAENQVAVAEQGTDVVGIAMAGPCPEGTGLLLHLIYVDHAHHGRGVGAALLDAVLAPHEPAALWVADPNPRAQAFYRKHGFVADGTAKHEDGLRALHMVRAG